MGYWGSLFPYKVNTCHWSCAEMTLAELDAQASHLRPALRGVFCRGTVLGIYLGLTSGRHVLHGQYIYICNYMCIYILYWIKHI